MERIVCPGGQSCLIVRRGGQLGLEIFAERLRAQTATKNYGECQKQEIRGNKSRHAYSSEQRTYQAVAALRPLKTIRCRPFCSDIKNCACPLIGTVPKCCLFDRTHKTGTFSLSGTCTESGRFTGSGPYLSVMSH